MYEAEKENPSLYAYQPHKNGLAKYKEYKVTLAQYCIKFLL